MKKTFKNLFVVVISLATLQVSAQKTNTVKAGEGKGNAGSGRAASDELPYINLPMAPGDPLNTRMYKLQNGLMVYIAPNKLEPRIQTFVAVRTGSKNDPADATGLAHYLEHMLFKGSDKYGSLDFAKEKKELNLIESLYETYRSTKNEDDRKKIYHQIDSVSGVAAKYAIANEYDKMMAGIGASGTNAFTSFDQTVYVNEIPSNQLDNWLAIEAERFRNPQMRIFHTELEAVYEEKNRSLDEDGDKQFEKLFELLFPKHPYGTQTTIGTIEHLKNPSIKKILDYYNTYYVPNNMAICIAGDVNPDEAIKKIEAKLGYMQTKAVPVLKPFVSPPLTSVQSADVVGPNPENVMFAYKVSNSQQDRDMLELLGTIMNNGTAGIIDLNLIQKQKVLTAYADPYFPNDYSILFLGAEPKQGQSLDECRNLLLDQLDKVKKGEFPDWLIKAAVNDLKLRKINRYERNSGIAMAQVDAFVKNEKWEDQVNQIYRLGKITKQQLMDFATKNFGNNYAIVYKRIGEDKNLTKVVKPEITPVEVNRDAQSPFLKSILESKPTAIEPEYIDFENDIQKAKINNEIPLTCIKNTNNDLFSLYYVWDMGTNHNKKIGLAIDYLQYLGTSKMSPEEVKQEFYKIGCRLSVFNSKDKVYVMLNGLSENADKAIALMEQLFSDAKPEKDALKGLVEDNLKARNDAKLDKNTILNSAMIDYAKYGNTTPFKNVLTEKEMRDIKGSELVDIIKELNSYPHKIMYYGPNALTQIGGVLNANHKVASPLKALPAETKFEELTNAKTKVYVVDFDMKQAEIMMISKGKKYDAQLEVSSTIFNEYFGGNMSSIVFQTLRESKALAYSCFARYAYASEKEKSNYMVAYIGSQADKLPEAMKSMTELLTDLPKSENMFANSLEAIQQRIRTERITKADILFYYDKAQKLGWKNDIRQDVFELSKKITFNDINEFQKQNIKGVNYNIMVLGKKEGLDIKSLEKYGPVQFLKLEDIFGY
ncbi:MAG: insulinase family protein [Bacteroidota bacterium]